MSKEIDAQTTKTDIVSSKPSFLAIKLQRMETMVLKKTTKGQQKRSQHRE
jgi:hypothetical protein